MLLLFAFYAYPEWLNKIHVYFLRIFSDVGISRTKFSNVLMITTLTVIRGNLFVA